MEGNKCFFTSNNKFFGHPARMDDGRHFTDYRSSKLINERISTLNGVQSSGAYKKFLTLNGQKFINLNRKYANIKNPSAPCFAPKINNKTVCKVNWSYSQCQPFDINGIGQMSIAASSQPYSTTLSNNLGREGFLAFSN